MTDSINIINTIQLILNGIAIIGGSAIWTLYIKNLKQEASTKQAQIDNIQSLTEFWKTRAGELEKQSASNIEKTLSDRIDIREKEIERLTKDAQSSAEIVQNAIGERDFLSRELTKYQEFKSIYDTIFWEGDEAGGDPDKAVQKSIKWLGNVGVDSGTLMITDPCYVNSEWNHTDSRQSENEGTNEADDSATTAETDLFPYSLDGAFDAVSKNGYGSLAYRLGHEGAGVAFGTAWGDGLYPVHAELHDGRIIRVYINTE